MNNAPVSNPTFDELVLRYEAELIKAALAQTNYSITRAARLLGMSHQRLSFMLKTRHRSVMVEMMNGEELIAFVKGLLPAYLPLEIREEAQAAIIHDLLTLKVKPRALKNRILVKRYVRAAYGFQDRYRFKSLDAPVGEGQSTLGELIAA